MQRATRTIRLATVLTVLAAAATPAHSQTDRTAALLTYPYVAVDTGAGADTTLHLSNTSNSAISAHCFYENANAHCSNHPAQVCSTDTACNGGVCTPGWSATDFVVHLTKLQPIGWRASVGCAPPQCSIPPVPELPFVGSMTCVAVDTDGITPVTRNDLTGGATLEVYDGAAGKLDLARYNAVGATSTGQNDGNQTLVLGGAAAEYAGCPNVNILSHFFDGAADPVSGAKDLFTTLVLLPCSRNPSAPAQPGHAQVQLLVFNEFEQQFGAFVSVSGLLTKRLSTIAPAAFDAAVVGTLTGQTRILSADSGLVALAIEEHQERADPTRITRAAMNLHTQGARVQPDYIGPKPGFCGDGVVDPGEGCDDGNTQAGDCCSPSCQPETSGQACSDDGNACTRDVCDGQGGCAHPAADPLPPGCGCCQAMASNMFAPHPCVGDCDGDGTVTALEVQICQDASTDSGSFDCATSCDAQGDFDVSPEDVAIAMANHLHGCPAGPNVCFAPADAQGCDAAFGTLVPGMTCDRTLAGADAFGCATVTPADQVTISGTCRRPGRQGLEACPAGTPITISKCSDPSCTTLQQVGATVADAQGQFSFMLDAAQVTNMRLIVETLVQDGGGGAAGGHGADATRVRSITFGPLAGGIRQVPVDPAHEAALQLLQQNGLQNYTDARVQGVVDAVAAANQGTNFAGLSVAAAIALAKATASADPTVQARLACAVDCNLDTTVGVDELIVAVNIALELASPGSCPAGDGNGDGRVTVDEIVDGVRRALTGCPAASK